MNIPIPFIGGGGGSSDDCTATASDVLEGKTAVYNGSGDEPAEGSMKDYSGTTSRGSSSLDEDNSRMLLQVPNTGKYDTNAYLYNSYSNIRSLIGLSASMIASGNEILGVTGTARVFSADQYTFNTSTSAHDRETWVTDLGNSVSMRAFTLSDIGISDIGFTPRTILITAGNTGVIAFSDGTNVFVNNVDDVGYNYPADVNSQYAFEQTSVHIPFYYTSNNILATVFIYGYT